jgi:TPP-dependent pyruvate/acetoin dehydrogenase alpha subunit
MAESTPTLKPVATKFSKETYLYWYELMQLIRQFETDGRREVQNGRQDPRIFSRLISGRKQLQQDV